MCCCSAGAVQSAHQRPALCRVGGLQADEEKGEGDVPSPSSPGRLIPLGELTSLTRSPHSPNISLIQSPHSAW